jgi:membrane associated rhomboid family serine protease
MWLIFTIQNALQLNLGIFGIEPRTTLGLVGIITSPMIHGNALHIASNTVPLLFLGWALFFFYPQIGKPVFYFCYFGTNVLIWLFARPSIHIGASGLVYGLAAFLIFFGIFKRDIKSIAISAVVILLYGGLVYGLLPNQPGVSWESHLFGAVIGGVVAYFMVDK